ncbi:MAG: VTC domain-containing protein, partial [Desertimonas sp.]
HRPEHRAALDPAALAFVDGLVQIPDGSARLGPVLSTRYRRVTLVDPLRSVRVTCDAGLVCTAADGSRAPMTDAVLIESKSAGRPTDVDRWLWRHGCRPVSISKFGVGLAAVRPELAANKWHRVLQRFFGRRGAPGAVADRVSDTRSATRSDMPGSQ